MIALLLRVMNLHAQFYEDARAISPEQIERFYAECIRRAGAGELMTPREMIRDFLFVLDALRENAQLGLDDLISRGEALAAERTPEESEDTVPARERRYSSVSPEDIEI